MWLLFLEGLTAFKLGDPRGASCELRQGCQLRLPSVRNIGVCAGWQISRNDGQRERERES